MQPITCKELEHYVGKLMLKSQLKLWHFCFRNVSKIQFTLYKRVFTMYYSPCTMGTSLYK